MKFNIIFNKVNNFNASTETTEMFYEESDINEVLTCPKCNQRYIDPRVLPCGESICFKCISNIDKESSNVIKCTYCSNFHYIPTEGFPKNIKLCKIIEKKSNEVYRGKAAQTLKCDLNEMSVKIKFLNNDLEMGIEQLKEYCDIIRKDIEQVKENIVQTIEKYHDEFIKKINMYQDASVENLMKESESRVYTYKLINETKYFIERWGSYLKKPFIDDVQITSASLQAKKYIVDLEKEIAQSQRNYLNENLLKFYKNLNSVNPIAIKLNQILEDFINIKF